MTSFLLLSSQVQVEVCRLQLLSEIVAVIIYNSRYHGISFTVQGFELELYSGKIFNGTNFRMKPQKCENKNAKKFECPQSCMEILR